MAKYTGPACKLCRREGEKLFLKGSRCFSEKCSFDKRSFAPGEHGRIQARQERESVYGKQLRAKQKARRVYGILERQFRRYFGVARRTTGLTGLNLLQTLEMRMDNVVYRMGLADSRAQARQLVTHGHFNLNGSRADIPSMLVRPGDVVAVEESSHKLPFFKELPDYAEKRLCAPWIERDLKTMSGRILRKPERAEIDGNLSEQLIVEYYSR
ncbi:MAG TPA: 30S ribosomal protein S4 [Anaerolineaceae bacterium]|jgi:small subunit ribosomal protein S4|nr:30S ribosomal protein S4 [Anaerolineaceae bacterium]HQF45382.1 30S ribosomal protein S4 [Anaerolineaceae bacterium]HQH35247.1 30S ribosomal protein S4 [Anaerolineaceae bacterium]HQJ03282.1 30S ribosomal protein S4 [Anaerolineaceae bacterium]HQO97658.1 30S ribosomal protein S4 [Anaerolineaceae bacterium]